MFQDISVFFSLHFAYNIQLLEFRLSMTWRRKKVELWMCIAFLDSPHSLARYVYISTDFFLTVISSLNIQCASFNDTLTHHTHIFRYFLKNRKHNCRVARATFENIFFIIFFVSLVYGNVKNAFSIEIIFYTLQFS